MVIVAMTTVLVVVTMVFESRDVCAGYVDDILEPRETRRRLCLDLETLATKNQSNPWKKHGNMPL